MTDKDSTPSVASSRPASELHVPREFADDLLRGADEIAEFLFGDRRLRRKVYHLATRRLPVFRLGGSKLCARRSVLLKFVTEQERRGARDDEDEVS